MTKEVKFAFSEHTLHRATRAVEAALYEDAARDAYFSSLHAAKQVVAHRTGKQSTSHSGTRKRLSGLIAAGLRLHRGSSELLARGYRHMLASDHLGEWVTVSREEAEDYLNRAAAFIAAAKAVCA